MLPKPYFPDESRDVWLAFTLPDRIYGQTMRSVEDRLVATQWAIEDTVCELLDEGDTLRLEAQIHDRGARAIRIGHKSCVLQQLREVGRG